MAKLITAIMYPNIEFLKKAKIELIKEFGETINESNEYKFTFTNYYEKEFDKNLKKRFIIFKKIINKKYLSDIKTKTIKIEDKFRINNKRTVNIDPGYISKKELVMASLKKASFKQDIGNKVFAHKILEFNKDKIIEFYHTFPDYRVKENQEFFQKSI